MTESERALIHWIKDADKLAAPSGQDSVSVHPQLKAENFSDKQQATDQAGILFSLSRIPGQGYICSEFNFSDGNFTTLARQTAGLTPGSDRWKIDQ